MTKADAQTGVGKSFTTQHTGERLDGGEWVRLEVDDGTTTRGFVARPSGSGPHPGLIVIMEALGVNAQIRDVARRYADEGFLAIAPDVFHRAEENFEGTKLDWERLMPLVSTLTTESLVSDTRAAHTWLGVQPDVDLSKVAAEVSGLYAPHTPHCDAGRCLSWCGSG